MFHQAYAFEPVPIDEFFKRYPEEKRDVEEFFKDSEEKVISGQDIVSDIITDDLRNRNKGNNLPELTQPAKITPRKADINIQSLENIKLLVLNRISGERNIVSFIPGQEKLIDNFLISVASCQKRIVNDSAHYTAVSFSVFDQKDNISKDKGDKNKDQDNNNLIFSNHIYIEMPGENAFEHPIYDIRPLACT